MTRQWQTQQTTTSNSSSTSASSVFRQRPFSSSAELETAASTQGLLDRPPQRETAAHFGHNFSSVSVESHPPICAVQRQVAADPTEDQSSSDDNLAQRIQSASGGGTSLDTGVQRQLEDGLGASLTQVRIHTDTEADALARAVSAKAFTTGQDIFFRAGAYNPNSPEGLHLLAHEATHTVQQASGPVSGNPAQGGVSISDPSDSFEQAAEQAAHKVVSGHLANSSNASNVTSAASGAMKVQRSFLDGNDPENDFWGVGPTANAAFSTVWDGIGMIPLAGPALSAGVDLAKATASGGMSAFYGLEAGAQEFFGMGNNTAARLESEKYGNAGKRFMHDFAWDALGAVPEVGTVAGLFAGQSDLEETIHRANGGEARPMVADRWHEMLSGLGL